MMNELISYNDSLMLRELGFDEPCFAWYKNGKLRIELYWNISDLRDEDCISPTYSQVFRWFREKYKMYYVIVKAESWFYTINGCNTQEGFNTYEEAELACLNKLIEIVKGGEQ